MSNANRSAVLQRLPKILRKHYQPWPVNVDRPLLEQLLFAACVEDAPYDVAEEAFASLKEQFFDWNEVRVTTIGELAEVLRSLPDAATAASRLRRTLQSVFESTYSFDMELLKKQNLGKAAQTIGALAGVSPFMVASVVQLSLGGHAIPLGRAEIGVCQCLALTSAKQAASGEVPGLERSVGKSKGIEVATLLHQFAADFLKNPFSPQVHKVLLEIDPECKDRLPKRGAKKPAETDAGPSKSNEKAKDDAQTGGDKSAGDKSAGSKAPAAERAKAEKSKSAETSSSKAADKAKDKPADKPADRPADRAKPPQKKKSSEKPQPSSKDRPKAAGDAAVKPSEQNIAKRKPR